VGLRPPLQNTSRTPPRRLMSVDPTRPTGLKTKVAALLNRFPTCQVTPWIIGLGNVDLSLALTAARPSFCARFDINPSSVEWLNRARAISSTAPSLCVVEAVPALRVPHRITVRARSIPSSLHPRGHFIMINRITPNLRIIISMRSGLCLPLRINTSDSAERLRDRNVKVPR
jgi:hypothetical protein